MHKAGFVNILGKPNAGKSTLLNALLGEKLAIITHKVQTTRHRILGFFNDEQHQLIFSDTPGIIKPAYKLQERMMKGVEESMEDADVFLLVLDATDRRHWEEKLPWPDEIEHRVQAPDLPLVVFINKTEQLSPEEVAEKMQVCQERFSHAKVLFGSALEMKGLEELMGMLKQICPEHAPYFDKEEITDRPVRFFVAEFIREKLLLHYKKEIPYHCAVSIIEYKEAEDIDRIRAEIYVGRDSQKAILIGHKGSRLKVVGTEARKDMEAFLGKKVYLELQVKVKKDWRDSEGTLSWLGYD
ncbi:MAG: GTPase Era [Bacteroidetes bacterium]|jgi:GTP-binding protein Era|nr:GTPase Era [Bacteroidota bacterium]MDA0930622.1 GTPase Era [Bacteroidota bacterium]